jgi:hypothetical protein
MLEAMMMRTVLALIVVAAASICRAEAPPAVDMTPVRDKMRLVSDGKGHYMAFPPLEQLSDFLFYSGDGKTFYRQRVYSGGSEGDIRFSRNLWEPRRHGRGASFEFRDKKYWIECGDRKVDMTPVVDADAKSLLGSAQFVGPRWKWMAYLLARDEAGKYYYVDRQREPPDSKNFRLYVGPKGNLKLQRMTNVVSDTEGDIFATKTGSLRLVTGKSEYTWIQGKARTKLTKVPVEDNAQLIYSELGAYTGEALGTPCDDL